MKKVAPAAGHLAPGFFKTPVDAQEKYDTLAYSPVGRLKEYDGCLQIRSLARHSRFAGPQDARLHGADARLWHGSAHPASLRRPAATEPRHALSRSAATRAARLDHIQVGHFGE